MSILPDIEKPADRDGGRIKITTRTSFHLTTEVPTTNIGSDAIELSRFSPNLIVYEFLNKI